MSEKPFELQGHAQACSDPLRRVSLPEGGHDRAGLLERAARYGLYDPRFEHDACGVGFVVDLQGRKSHDLVRKAIQVLLSLLHRGACGCEANTGDGAGILLQTPDRFLRKVCDEIQIRLPPIGEYGVGMVFLPNARADRERCEQIFKKIIKQEGQRFLGWRTVPTDNESLGFTAKAAQPVIRQIFIGARPDTSLRTADSLAFERKLYVIRKRVENEIKKSAIPQRDKFYIPSLSCKTIVYKGMLKSDQITAFYPELLDPDVETGLAMVHSRFSTNTFPNWARAHPYRYLSHNGEINTLRGNVNWMHARQTMFRSELFGEDIKKLLPIIDESGSDSAMFDNALEMLVLTGRNLPHAVMMMIPEPWSGHESMSPEKRAFYEYHSCLMEPWDGPASIAFTDGVRIGAVLDRNGLRPSRYYVTKDGLVVMASEVGVLDIPPENVLLKGRLQPGRMFLVDTEQGRIIADDELKHTIATERPYAEWLSKNLVSLEDLPNGEGEASAEPYRANGSAGASPSHAPDHESVLLHQQAFGYTNEDLRLLMAPMAADGTEALGSMGTDTPLAVLSDRPQLLYNYFKQLFAQVTNPPVDCIREELIMSMETTIGPEANLLEPTPESARQIKLKSPIITNEELERLRHLHAQRGVFEPLGFKSITLPMLFKVREGAAGLAQAMDELCEQASQAIADGCQIIILSDRNIDRDHTAIPALLAVSGVHHHLIREGTRVKAGLVLETGEPREVHHFSLLIGYGAGAINPYLAFETLEDMIDQGMLTGSDAKHAIKNYIKAINKGVLKVMSKMGISTAQSYCGAQIFEAIGLGRQVIDKYFTWTASRVGGVGLDVIAQEVKARHDRAFPERPMNGHQLDVGGQYQWRRDGELHLFNPETVHKLQYAVRANNYQIFKQYSEQVNNQSRRLCTLRGLMELKLAENPIPIEEVESVESIMKRFKSGAMSYGSISQEAHETLAVAMNRIGGKSNTGEGGEDPARYVLEANGDSKNSAIKQVASGRFGVTSLYLVNAKELQIKMAQGAKPGEGGQLPGHKVYPWIARVRHSTPGVGLISPPPHHDIYSIEDLAELIHDLKNGNHHARISVKLVAEVGVGTIAAGVAKAHSDVVLISGHDGGTGASPLTSIKHAGAPWELGLAETHQVLVLNDLRSRIVVEVDGQLKTGRDVVIGALLGAEEFGFATAPLVALGCVMMRVCHLNTCPVGVATQDPKLRAKFTGGPEHVVNFMRFIAQEVRELMAQLGFRTLNEMIGRTDKLQVKAAVEHYKAKGLDYSAIFYQPEVPAHVGRYCQIPQDHGLDKALDNMTLLKLCEPALERGEKVEATLPIRNVNRVVGTIVGSELTRRYGAAGLPDDTIRLHFKGSAGQSFGAFVPHGMTLTLEGDSNDYIGKGLSGGKIIVYPPEGSTFVPEENVIIGNVAFYGATGGLAFVRGVAGERFCVRNSGVHAVVEGVGDHGCEYMTGGRVVVLGPTGRNFAAGMSGGIAYVLDETGAFPRNCNQEMVKLYPLEDAEEIEAVQALIRRHAEYTKSERAWKVLALWEAMVPKFVKVYPNDYRRVIEKQKKFKAEGLSDEEAVMAAFEENAHDLMRVGGK
jgi:glutamate synthase domain-containing protein 2/glutamate synthase domain-containing protein 1/glutamate synthase domain-containing protein 3